MLFVVRRINVECILFNKWFLNIGRLFPSRWRWLIRDQQNENKDWVPLTKGWNRSRTTTRMSVSMRARKWKNKSQAEVPLTFEEVMTSCGKRNWQTKTKEKSLNSITGMHKKGKRGDKSNENKNESEYMCVAVVGGGLRKRMISLSVF